MTDHFADVPKMAYHPAMETATSSDGTRIAFERTGSGPPLVLVHGTTADHTRWSNILSGLNRHFTVLAMDRRGRGKSGDGDSYSIGLEADDIAAVVRAAGDRVRLLGHSFGALCAMEAALALDNLSRLVLYEPPFSVGGNPLYPPEMPGRLQEIFETGGREALLIAFFREVVGASDEQLAALRADPSWQARISGAHTTLREMADRDYHFDPERFRRLDVPTLMLVGENSPVVLTAPARALHEALPDSRLTVLEGQGHVAMTTAPDLFLDTVTNFLLSGD
jgi:pimeloyl-ACP methyl ester carboxylesterase